MKVAKDLLNNAKTMFAGGTISDEDKETVKTKLLKIKIVVFQHNP